MANKAQDILDAIADGHYDHILNKDHSDEYVYAPGGPFTIRTDLDPQPNTITLRAGAEEMIRCNPEGFWVRGEKVEQDDKEAEVVYNAFKQWLTWAQLNDLR